MYNMFSMEKGNDVSFHDECMLFLFFYRFLNNKKDFIIQTHKIFLFLSVFYYRNPLISLFMIH